MKRGLKAIAVQNPLSSLADDVTAAHRVIGMQEGPVLLVGHSWGGAVITEAGNHPQVKGLVYVAAGAPDSGQSFADWWKDYKPAPGAAEIKPYGEGYVALTSEGVRKHFVQDVPSDEADIVYATQGPLAGEVLRRQSHRGSMALQTKLVHRRSARRDYSSRCRARFR